MSKQVMDGQLTHDEAVLLLRECQDIINERDITIAALKEAIKQQVSPLGHCCYGGTKTKEQCGSCAAWEAIKRQGEPEGREVRLTAPEKIYLLVSEESIHDDEPFPDDHEGINWCEDAALDCYVPYVRADLAYTSAPTIPTDVEKDADRYRWLRNYRPGLILDMMDDREIPNSKGANDLDDAIDIALSAAPKGEQP
jgi:hypothetical protein